MYEYIQGQLVELNPTYAVIDTGNIAYFINISLNTYSGLEGKEGVKLYLHQVVREDAQLLFGFAEKQERELFRLLITVSGIGSNTARMMLSSLQPIELETAILESNVNVLKSVKGIGLKTAQRVIIDLKDKIGKTDTSEVLNIPESGIKKEEALSALVMLGFNKTAVDKTLSKVIKENPDFSVEELIKIALKRL
ncbi:MAG: Holliday junction branch migration protein RuvA [Bacteroidetes bacterium 4572_117]|nr:MAG: Holliday junction branch migration protein RuvA [Bacteroidetes bacterium 4572_117]